MKRIPILATAIVAAAVLLMISLGLWQLQRAQWKDRLLARYHANASLSPTAFPAVPRPDDALLFRRATGLCLEPTAWSARAGHNRAGENGWRHLALCRTGAEGPGMLVDLGWSTRSDPPKGYRGGPVTGMIGPDKAHLFLLVADQAAPGLEPSAPPSMTDVPNDHRSYAIQWFSFAAIALVIYGLAVRQKLARGQADG